MKYLKRFNESTSSDVDKILRKGFKELIERSHIVSDQVEDNMDKFIEEFDVEKFENKFGKIKEFLGVGVFGSVFSLDNGKTCKIFKITFDFHEAPFLYEYCFLKKTPGFVIVDGVWKIKFGNTNAYLIVRDPVRVLEHNEFSKHIKEVRSVEKAMYDISPNWRGTHMGNYAFQDGKVVLYDGFCKKAIVDETKIPLLEL